MAFVRPTLNEIVDRVQADFVARLSLAGAVLRRSFTNVLTRVIAGATHMLHGHLEYLSRQLFPDISDEPYLIRQASIFGLAKDPATYAQATVSFTGSNGSVIPAGTALTRADGAEYTVDADATIASGTATGALTAKVAGAVGTLPDGAILSFQSPVSGVDSTATVGTSTADGTDEESTDAFRLRLLERLAEPAHGGNVADYIAWAKRVTGVTRVWVTPWGLGPGTVVVRFVRDDDVGSIIPSGGEVADVQAKIDEEKPAHAAVTVIAPVAAPINFNISVTPNTTAVKDAVSAELAALLLRATSPGGTVLLSSLLTAIGDAVKSVANDDGDFTLNSPSADVTNATNALSTMGTITWS